MYDDEDALFKIADTPSSRTKLYLGLLFIGCCLLMAWLVQELMEHLR